MHILDLGYDAMIMRSLFRFFLWLSITVLSFQGSAAIACGQTGMPAHETMLVRIHQHDQAIVQPDTEHCHKTGANPISSHAKCAACASCCAGAAAPPALLPALHLPLLASPLQALAEAAIKSTVPSTLDRPPRHDLG